jgi:Flp pilus assembly protein TadB
MSGRTYEMRRGQWQEIEAQRKARTGPLLRGLGALAGLACAVAAIAAIGIVATAVALVLWPLALFAVWLGSFKKRRSQ